MLAVFLPIRGRIVSVIGGGNVGRRRAAICFDEGADVTVVDPAMPDDADPRFPWRRRTWCTGDIERAFLVFACVSINENATIVAACRAARVLVVSSDSESPGDLVLPAVVKRGPLQIAVSTGGAAPSLARNIRDRLAAQFDDSWTLWLELLGRMRSRVLATVADAAVRTALLRDLGNEVWLGIVRDRGVDAAEILMRVEIDSADRTIPVPIPLRSP